MAVNHKFLVTLSLCLLIIAGNLYQPLLASESSGLTRAAAKGALTGEKSTPSFTVKSSTVKAAPGKQVPEQKTMESKQTTADAQPRMVIESPRYDAGKVWEGRDIVHTFTVKNTGTAELRIRNVKAG